MIILVIERSIMIELVDIYFERDNKIILNNINLKLEKNTFY